jgi:hypothetical protein
MNLRSLPVAAGSLCALMALAGCNTAPLQPPAAVATAAKHMRTVLKPKPDAVSDESAVIAYLAKSGSAWERPNIVKLGPAIALSEEGKPFKMVCAMLERTPIGLLYIVSPQTPVTVTFIAYFLVQDGQVFHSGTLEAEATRRCGV